MNPSNQEDKPSSLKKFGLPAALLAGGLAAGMAFAPVGLAGAQEDTDPVEPDTEAPADDSEAPSDNDGRRGRRGGHGIAKNSEVIQDLTGLTQEQLREGFQADQTLAEQAAAVGVSQDDLVAAIVADIQTRIADGVASGDLTQERADEMLADLEAKVTTRVTTVPSEREGHGHRGKRFGGFEVLEDLGLTQDEVRAGFQAGNTLAETAAEQGISEDALVDALVSQAMERADAAVADGKITQEEADEKLADVEARITERVNADPADRPERGQRGPRGSGGETQDTATA